jgi:prepilin-type N-terminal cleavage/methylation domain-containing protein
MKKGFTLAEVLITLGIIGVVAALTIPGLVASYQEKVTVTKLKKLYTTLSQAYEMARIEYGDPAQWCAGVSTLRECSLIFGEHLTGYLKTTKYCGIAPGCFSPGMIKNLDGLSHLDLDNYQVDSPYSQAKFILSDGTPTRIVDRSFDCSAVYGATEMLSSVCVTIDFDINGFGPPNQFGKDIFGFGVTREGVIPLGTKEHDIGDLEGFSGCNTSGFGWACTAWVIYNENMDYLRCDDLSWEGKTKCN